MKKLKYFIFSLICLFSCSIVFADNEVIIKSITPMYDQTSSIQISNENNVNTVIFNDIDQVVTYNVVIQNTSGYELTVDELNLSKTSQDFLIYELEGISKGDVLKSEETKELVVTLKTIKENNLGSDFNQDLLATINFEKNVTNPFTSTKGLIIVLMFAAVVTGASIIVYRKNKLARYVALVIVFLSIVPTVEAQNIICVQLKFNAIYESSIPIVQEEIVKKSGKIIRVDDVSETLHTPTITLTSDTITDFSSVSVIKTGKNILDTTKASVNENLKNFKIIDSSRNAIQFTKNIKESSGRSSIGVNMYLPAGTYYTSGNVTVNNETVKRIAAIVISPVGSGEQIAQSRFGEDITPVEYTNSFDITESGWYTVRICTMYNAPINTTYTISNIQIEYGHISEFEPYTSQTVLADSNGTVNGINMISPSTTLFTESDVLIDLEYLSNKSLNNSTTDTPEVPEQTSVISKTVTTVNAGDVISLESNAIKKNKTLTFNANITTLGSVELRHGKNDLGASKIVINNTTIEFYNVSSSTTLTPVLTTSFEHGLTINGDTNIVASADNNYTLSVSITSNGKTFTKDGINWTGSNGAIELQSTGTTMSNLTLTWDCSDYSDEIWIFGDSFVEINSTERWPYYILPNYDNFLLSGYRGSVSSKMYTDFQAALKHGTPKYAVWILGMNDPDSSTTVNSSWKTNVDKFITTCKSKGITPILATIPNVPDRINYYKNEYIRNSGYRYIDFATAVGGNEIGSGWTEGMLNTDKVHPTATGAQALANQILIDLPELKN